jgi:hypothetical protein
MLKNFCCFENKSSHHLTLRKRSQQHSAQVQVQNNETDSLVTRPDDETAKLFSSLHSQNPSLLVYSSSSSSQEATASASSCLKLPANSIHFYHPKSIKTFTSQNLTLITPSPSVSMAADDFTLDMCHQSLINNYSAHSSKLVLAKSHKVYSNSLPRKEKVAANGADVYESIGSSHLNGNIKQDKVNEPVANVHETRLSNQQISYVSAMSKSGLNSRKLAVNFNEKQQTSAKTNG